MEKNLSDENQNNSVPKSGLLNTSELNAERDLAADLIGDLEFGCGVTFGEYRPAALKIATAYLSRSSETVTTKQVLIALDMLKRGPKTSAVCWCTGGYYKPSKHTSACKFASSLYVALATTQVTNSAVSAGTTDQD